MSFETFARVALDRGDSVRAMLILIEGLKRHPENEQALAMLVNLYGAHSTPGLERDVVHACAAHDEAPYILGQLLNRLDARGMTSMAAHIEQAADALGVPIELIPAEDPDSDLLTLSQLEALIAEAEREPYIALDEHDYMLSPDELPTLPPEGGAPVDEADAGADAGFEAGLDAGPDDARADSQPVFDTDPPGLWAERFEEPVSPRQLRDPDTASAERAASAPGRSRAGLRAVALVLLVGACTATGWFVFARSAADAAQERHVEVFDPLMPTAYEVARSRAEERWGEREDMAGRDAFVAALRALEQGEPAPQITPRETAWAYAAQAQAALSAGDQRAALSSLAALERRWPDALPTLWTRARLDEARGHMAQAQRAYTRLHDVAPRFIPALVGAIRASHAIGDVTSAQRAAQRLTALNPAHPYLAIAAPTALTLALWERTQPITPPRRARVATQPAAPDDAHLRALASHEAAISAWRRGELDEAWEASQAALKGAPWSPDVMLVHAALQAARGDAMAADATFERLASVEGLPVARRLELMWIAPRALSLAGRPDLGWRWTIATPQLAAERAGLDATSAPLPARARPVALSLTLAQLDAAPRDLVAHAALARAQTLRLWGKGALALEALELMESLPLDERGAAELAAPIELERGLSLVESGQLQRAEGWVEHHAGSPAQPVVAAWLALAQGKAGRAVEIMRAANEATQDPSPEAWRALLYAMASAGQGEAALALMEQRRPSPPHMPALRDVAHMLYAGSGLDDATPADHAAWAAPARLATLAYAQLMAGQEVAAAASAERALELAPASPEVARVAALVARSQGHQERAASIAQAAGLGEQAGVRLWLDLGQLSLERRRAPAAREAFERVLEARPDDAAALSGLVRACEVIGAACREPLLARWGAAQRDPVRALMLARGLAILSGSRAGSAEGLVWLEEGRRRGADDPELLVEFAAYWRALGQDTRAREAYLGALAVRDSFAPAHLGLARLALKAKQMPQAHEHLTRYLALAPRGADADWARRQLESK